jgi:aspartate racemase
LEEEKSMRTIGLIGGMSWQSSVEYYKIVNEEVQSRLGLLRSSQCLMHSVDFGPIERAQHDGRWDDTAVMLEDAARKLQAGGAACIVLCTNTMHKVADRIQRAVTIPFLHIADPVGRAARDRGSKTVGLLGTAFTMEQGFMKDRLSEQYGLSVLVPSVEEREAVHRIIYDELCVGIVRSESLRLYLTVIDSLVARGADSIILGCTEITLLVKQKDSPVPLLDTTALHAKAAVDFSLEAGDASA